MEPRRSSRRPVKKKQDEDYVYDKEEEEEGDDETISAPAMAHTTRREAAKRRQDDDYVYDDEGDEEEGAYVPAPAPAPTARREVVKQEHLKEDPTDAAGPGQRPMAAVKVEAVSQGPPGGTGQQPVKREGVKAEGRRRVKEEDEDWEEEEEEEEEDDDEPDAGAVEDVSDDEEEGRGRKKRKQKKPAARKERASSGKRPAKKAKGGRPGEAYGDLKNYSLENLPAPLLEFIVDLLLDTHELRSWMCVLKDMCAVRATCKTLREAVAPFLPAVEAGLISAPTSRYGSRARPQWPLQLARQSFAFYTPALHALLGQPEGLSQQDVRDAYLFFGLGHYEVQLHKMRHSLQSCRPPRLFGFSPLLRVGMSRFSSERVNKTTAKADYSLRDADLDLLPHKKVENPINPRYTPSQMFEVWRLQEVCLKRHGSLRGLDRFQNKSEVAAEKARATKECGQASRRRQLGEELALRGLAASRTDVEFYFQEHIRHKTGSVHLLVSRALDLARHLHLAGSGTLKLPKRSHLARAYIDGDASAKRRHKAALARAQTKAQQRAKQSGKPVGTVHVPAPVALPPLAQLASTIEEAHFFETQTSFLTSYEAVLQPFRDVDLEEIGDYDYDDYGYGDYDDAPYGFMGGGGYWGFFRRYNHLPSSATYDDASEEWDVNPVAVPNEHRAALEMRDDRWAEAMRGAASGERPKFKRIRDQALKAWMSENGLIHSAAGVQASALLPESLKELAVSLL